MSFDYTGLREETVQPLIEEFGKPGAILVSISSDVLVDRAGKPLKDRAGVPITVRAVGSAAPYRSQLDDSISHPVTLMQTVFKKADNRGTLVEAGDVLYLVSTQGVTIDPELADRITVDSLIYQIIRIDPLTPAPVVMFWYIHARK